MQLGPIVTVNFHDGRDILRAIPSRSPSRLGVPSLDPDQWPVSSTDVQDEVAPALVVLHVSGPVVFAPLYAPVPPLIVNVPLYVAAVALVYCPRRLYVPYTVPTPNQFLNVPLSVAAPVVALTVAL